MNAVIFIGFLIYAILDFFAYCGLANRIDEIERELKKQNGNDAAAEPGKKDKFIKEWWERGE